jgi:hypothetical protein
VETLRLIYVGREDQKTKEGFFARFFARFFALGFVTGCIERFIATTLLIWAPNLLAPFVGAWIALKLAANWASVKERSATVRRNHMVAILGSTISFSCIIVAVLIFTPEIIVGALKVIVSRANGGSE